MTTAGAEAVQDAAGGSAGLAYVDKGYTGEKAAEAAEQHGIALEVVKLPAAKRGFVLVPRRWVVERSFAWATRCRRLVKDHERYAETLAGVHLVAFVTFVLKNAALFGARAQYPLSTPTDFLPSSHRRRQIQCDRCNQTGQCQSE